MYEYINYKSWDKEYEIQTNVNFVSDIISKNMQKNAL